MVGGWGRSLRLLGRNRRLLPRRRESRRRRNRYCRRWCRIGAPVPWSARRRRRPHWVEILYIRKCPTGGYFTTLQKIIGNDCTQTKLSLLAHQ